MLCSRIDRRWVPFFRLDRISAREQADFRCRDAEWRWHVLPGTLGFAGGVPAVEIGAAFDALIGIK
jgi:hypothetical protein